MKNEDSVKGLRNFVRTTQLKAFFSGILISFFLYFFIMKDAGYGFFCGTLISIVNFQLMFIDVLGVATRNSVKAKWFIFSMSLIRYSIIICTVVLIITRTEFNVFALFAGIFTIQAVLVFEKFFQGFTMFMKK
jgi:hypothetical protein